jgi:long-chain acyl-CoA synthetase
LRWALHALGLARGETLAVIGENEPEHYWAEFAAQALGAKVGVGLSRPHGRRGLQYLSTDSERQVYLFAQDQEQVDKALAVAPRLPDICAHRLLGRHGHVVVPQRPAARLRRPAGGGARGTPPPARSASSARSEAGGRTTSRVLSYTSGTTGKPKGVILTHRYLIDNAHRMISATGASPGMEYSVVHRAGLGHRAAVRRHAWG